MVSPAPLGVERQQGIESLLTSSTSRRSTGFLKGLGRFFTLQAVRFALLGKDQCTPQSVHAPVTTRVWVRHSLSQRTRQAVSCEIVRKILYLMV